MPSMVVLVLLSSIGIFSIQRLDDPLIPGHEEKWIRFRDAIMNRVNSLNVVSSVIIAYAAVFLSTTSPNPTLVNWNSHTASIGFGGTLVCGVLSVLVGGLISYIFTDMQAEDLRGERCKKFKMTFLISFLLLHTLFLGGTMLATLIAMHGAVWDGNSGILKAGSVYSTLLGITILVLWAVFGIMLFSREPGPNGRFVWR
ncbi:hypothetical protein FRB93_002793 [Tulasnella sp. JGI-2019a]|nr:hypothetical protein FRB93_002793 [Tulasnella sp. JGI-2019a]